MKPMYLLKSTLVAGALLTAGSGRAQMVGTDIFLRGTYVEVGIGHLGYYGSDGLAPTGYHPHTGSGTTGHIGFVADPLATGWSTGTSHYMGDFFYPGFPFEGWAMQIDGTERCQGYNTASSSSYLYISTTSGATGSGANVSYASAGSTVSGTWQGVFDSVQITQVTTLDTNDLYFSVELTFTNLASAPKNNIYYFRSLDPDNDESWPGGSFSTNNMINYQMPDTFNVSAVTATALGDTNSKVTLGTTDTASRAVIYNSWPISTTEDLASVYAGVTSSGGTSYYTAGINHPGDIAIGLIVNIPHLATVDSAGDSVLRTTAGSTLHPANTAKRTFFYAFSKPGLDSAISRSHGASGTPTLGVKNINSQGAINVYPNPSKDIVSITGLSTTDHILLYDMMGRDVSQSWTINRDGLNTFRYNNLAPGAYIIVITDAGGNMKSRIPVRKL